MASNREHLFPATSIGRTQGSQLQRVPSHESLTAHPLLSSNHSLNPDHGPNSGSNVSSGQRYVPYTPRQRVTPTSATTGTIFHPPSPQHQQGDATSTLQLMNSKAAAQGIGLDTGSIGWAILEKLVSESDQRSGEWTEIWEAITTGKATLLLPVEQGSAHDLLTPEFIKDHVALCETALRKTTPIVTLSGLRGTLENQTLTFRSSLHPSSKIFQDLLVPSTRTAGLASLPSLPLSPSIPSSPPSLFPTFTLPTHTYSIPLPPHSPSIFPPKPPLPPRPANRTVSTPNPTVPPTTRISNPFASLFGHSSQSVTKPLAATPPSAPVNASPPSSLRSFDSHSQSEPVMEVQAFSIDKKIVQKEVGKQMNKALRKEVKASLSEAFLPNWAVDRVHEFTSDWYPLVKDPTQQTSRLGRGLGSKSLKEGGGNSHVINPVAEAPEVSSERLQDFYLSLEQDLRIGGFGGRVDDWGDAEEEKQEKADRGVEDERRVQEKIDGEAKIKEAMDVVERAVCSLFYDRLYMQPTSDDSSHDETLSSRVAALNMLDLGLEHLDIHVDNTGPEVDAVVKACGEMLSQLDTCQSPGDKAAVLVAAHKIVVDGLSRLPPIRLMSEEESKAQKSKTALTKADVPPRGADGKLRIMTPISPGVAASSDDSEILYEVAAPDLSRDEKTPNARELQHSPIPTIIEPLPSKSDIEDNTSRSAPSSTISSVSQDSPVDSKPSVLTMSPPPKEPTPISGDVLLPLIIFSVVKANPPHLVSNLLYTQRYRNQSIGGEESYCLINLMAVAEFLENVDLVALGLSDSDKVMSAADLTPIPLNRSPVAAETPLASIDGLRGRVEQANKVITDVVDSSFGMLRSLLPNTTPARPPPTPPTDGVQGAAPWNAAKPGFGLLRRESGFSIKSITSALPMSRGGTRGGSGEESGQQLITVSRPSSVKSSLRGGGVEEESSEIEGGDESGVDSENGDYEGGGDDDGASGFGDARSIRSFESMLGAKGKRRDRTGAATRKSLTDRLAHMSSLAGMKGSPPPRPSLLPHGTSQRGDTPASSRPVSPAGLCVAPPIQRFVDCNPGDLRLSEVGELLRDYRRLVEAIRAVNGFEE